VLRALDDLVRAGKVRYVGASNFSAWQLAKSVTAARHLGLPRYVAHQAYYSLIGRDYEWELMPLARDQNVSAIVWSPLGWGRLTGKVRRNAPLPSVTRLHSLATIGPQVDNEYLYCVVDMLDEVAMETGKTIPQIALNWLLQRPTVVNVIVGARDENQLRDNIGALGWTLSAEQMQRLDQASARPAPYPTWYHNTFALERNPPLF
jgi:aryl-alcohol dehydrogenase-like predicted oxidoreductase